MSNSEVTKAIAELYTWLQQGARDRPNPDAVAILLLEHHRLLAKVVVAERGKAEVDLAALDTFD